MLKENIGVRRNLSTFLDVVAEDKELAQRNLREEVIIQAHEITFQRMVEYSVKRLRAGASDEEVLEEITLITELPQS